MDFSKLKEDMSKNHLFVKLNTSVQSFHVNMLQSSFVPYTVCNIQNIEENWRKSLHISVWCGILLRSQTLTSHKLLTTVTER